MLSLSDQIKISSKSLDFFKNEVEKLSEQAAKATGRRKHKLIQKWAALKLRVQKEIELADALIKRHLP